MKDPRFNTLAENIVKYSLKIQPGEKVLIEVTGFETELAKELIQEIYQAGGLPFISIKGPEINRVLLQNTTQEHLEYIARWESQRMQEMSAYIGIRAGDNSYEMSAVPEEKMQLYMKYWVDPVHHGIRVPKTKWVVLRYPNNSMAQLAGMSTDDFSDFYFNVCNLDYRKMSQAMDPLVELLNKTDQVKITGPGTDLSFSIKGIPAIKCDGHLNIPDGEVYTAPVRDSIEGTITYNTATSYQGSTFENISFEFKQGKIIKARCNQTDKLNKILDTDEGARFIGEFALGVNPYITKPMNDTLFDEKIMGSFHFTPGSSYQDAFNGNKSAIHWDLVSIQTEAYGGGQIYFDDVLIRDNGQFVPQSLQPLNPENLK
ncbi:aminopeptidase [Dehalobacterium formicoaceticum]|uniref:Aminopeptidase n=1 Tax=Dehalobacterium formicoaceticum TaxID=51515 RepID=A0ABT1Y3Z4_9FIRM|nr:aminopeptidase [Dehalobacterium formicoaceticum]MCR6545597.1 aminopeptidase [Dehalobacterium formicoaceticum]